MNSVSEYEATIAQFGNYTRYICPPRNHIKYVIDRPGMDKLRAAIVNLYYNSRDDKTFERYQVISGTIHNAYGSANGNHFIPLNSPEHLKEMLAGQGNIE